MAGRRRFGPIGWVLVLAGLVVLVVVVLVGYRALEARRALVDVAADLEKVSQDLHAGDTRAARSDLESAQADAERADEATGGPTWWVLTHTPVVGDDAEAVRTVAEVSRVLADDVLGDVIAASETLDPEGLRPEDGRVDLAHITQVAPSILAADRELRRQAAKVRAIDTGSLLAQVASPVERLQEKLEQAEATSSRAAYTVRLLPPMLGADGPRTYLVLFQNNAEVRATGGIPGAIAVLRTDRGKVSIVHQGTSADLGFHPQPPVRLTSQEVRLYERKLGMFAADINFTPDFPRTAEIARAMWRETQGEDVDGVLSADPVALSYLLQGTGPVRVPGGPLLSSSEAVNALLNGIYLTEPDEGLQNRYFAAAARAVFDAVAAGRGDPATVVDGITLAGEEGRLYAWSSRPGEERLLADTTFGGALPRQAGPSPYVGVFLNDGTGAKMQYYLDHRVDVRPVDCNDAGRQKLEVTVTLTSNAPADARNLPTSVIGPREGNRPYFGVRPGDMRMNVYLYAPIGGWIDASAVDGEETPMSEAEHDGHPVGARTVTLAPGQTRRLTYTVMTGLDQPEAVDLRVTPGVHTSGVGRVGRPVCTNG